MSLGGAKLAGVLASLASLPPPACYFPLVRGRYDVAAGLTRLGADMANGETDGHVFQLDREWLRCRQAKLTSRAEAYSKYVCRNVLPPAVEQAMAHTIAQRLALEHPQYFDLTPHCADGWVLQCALTGDVLIFNRSMQLDEVQYGAPVNPPYRDAWDALACQVQEDLAIDQVLHDGSDELIALHVCLPNHWAPQDKLGRPFAAVHEPVPNFERLARQSKSLLRTIVERGPFVRFAWGIATDTQLNHHPVPPAAIPDDVAWHGRRFDPALPRLYLRIERQTTCALAGEGAFLFTLRTYFRDVTTLSNVQCRTVAAAIQSMDTATLAYKGVLECKDSVVEFLLELAK